MADIADDGLVLHGLHVAMADDPDIAGGGDEDIARRRRLFHGDDAKPFHGRLQGADRVDFRDPDRGAHAAQRLGAALADIAIAADHRGLAGDHHVGGPFDAVDQATRGNRKGCRTWTWSPSR